jgi:hypothetical protein
MARPTTEAELAAAAHTEFDRLWAAVEIVPVAAHERDVESPRVGVEADSHVRQVASDGVMPVGMASASDSSP